MGDRDNIYQSPRYTTYLYFGLPVIGFVVHRLVLQGSRLDTIPHLTAAWWTLITGLLNTPSVILYLAIQPHRHSNYPWQCPRMHGDLRAIHSSGSLHLFRSRNDDRNYLVQFLMAGNQSQQPRPASIQIPTSATDNPAGSCRPSSVSKAREKTRPSEYPTCWEMTSMVFSVVSSRSWARCMRM